MFIYVNNKHAAVKKIFLEKVMFDEYFALKIAACGCGIT